jgi:UPF0755 protein
LKAKFSGGAIDLTPQDDLKRPEPEAAKASLFARARAPKPPRDPKPKKKRSRSSLFSQLSVVFSLVLVGAFVGMAGFVTVLLSERRAGPLAEDKTVILGREDDDGPIADQLEKAGVIDNSTIFSIMTLLDGQRSALKRGEYDFHAGISMREVEDLLAHHRVVRHKLSIPEGLTSEQIMERIRDSDLLVGEVKDIPREGSLYPDTYVFERGDSRAALIAHMVAAQTKMVTEIWAKRAPDLPVKSPGELVTLASIVEKETGRPDERPKVAGVFVNRLNKHMRLQSDPTIVYGLVFGKGTLGHSITKAELQEATPYNTYAIDGLPPGPICNPGKLAMEAVGNPARTHDLFFVADGTGGHAFAETLDQHAKNVAHWRQIEKDAKDKLSPEATPPGNIRGEAFPLSDTLYGDLGPFAAPPSPVGQTFGALAFATAPAAAAPAPAAAALAAKLGKVADSRRKMTALLGAGGSLSPEKLGGAKFDSVVVTGVNDPPPGADDPIVADTVGPMGSAPVSPAMLADMKARAARYGDSPVTYAALPAPADAPAVVATAPINGKPRVFDASEGTRLDPLRNRSYDLNSAKEIPASLFR